jgi:molybdenum cofactor biosynthesis enzyme MoaA
MRGYLIFSVTNRCNFPCNFCFYSAFRCFMGTEKNAFERD